MGVTYFKRYRMEFDLRRPLFEPPRVSSNYHLLGWDDSLISLHAATKYECFRFEIDANVFSCLGDRDGCRRLMEEISKREGFVHGATWLLQFQPPGQPAEYCGTIQGVRDKLGLGGIQNVGVTESHRGNGLGTLLIHQALNGFLEAGLRRAYLEVTAQNSGALRLYRRLGFRTVKTVYKTAEVEYV